MNWRQTVRAETARFDARIVSAFTMACVVIVTYFYYFRSPMNLLPHSMGRITMDRLALYRYFAWHGGAFIILFIAPFLSMTIINHFSSRKYSPISYTFNLGDYKTGAILTLLFTSVTVSIHYILVLAGFISPEYYPMCKSPLIEKYFLVFFLFETFQFVYIISFEYFFRGFILFESAKIFGNNALVVTLLPYIMIKFGKPPIEIYTAILVGLALSYMTLKTRSFWYAAIAHGLLATIVDVLSAYVN